MSTDLSSAPQTPDDESIGDLVSKFSHELSQLIRQELQLAQAEVSGKAKKAGTGAGLLGVAGLLAVYGVAVVIAAAIAALALALQAWLAAAIVAAVVFALAGVLALLGKTRLKAAASPMPERAVDNIKRDVATIRHGHAD